MENSKYKNLRVGVLCAGLGTVAILIGSVANDNNRVYIGLVQGLMAVILYFLYVLGAGKRNWMDIRALFTGAWIGTIGLATMRLAEYQEVWQVKTWLLLASAYLLFQLGATLGIFAGNRFSTRVTEKIKQISPVELVLYPNRLYYICVITTLVGLLCLIANVLIRGYIPFMASDGNSYAQFYTKFYLFAVAASMISGLCYYCIKTQKCTVAQKVVLYICILYSTIIFPLLVVSRGTFVTSALSLATSVFYQHRKKLLPLAVCAVLIVGVYMYASTLRDYSVEQLNVFFEPATIVLNDKQEQTENTEAATETTVHAPGLTEPTEGVFEPTAEPAVPTEPAKDNSIEFSLSPQMAFLYTYLTIGHDNFNEAVQNAKGYTYGARQLVPFNVILRIQALNTFLENQEYYKVREHLTVTNILGDAYYDFHSWGMLLMLLWSFVFGVIQAAADQERGPFSIMALGISMTPIILATFATWMSEFSHWMHWGLILVLCIIACTGKRKAK